ncbi:MAG: hypothetical protein WC378_01925 [Opitutaceae bacterium]
MKARTIKHKSNGGFTLLEAVFASVVMALGVSASITAVSQCMQIMDTSRSLTYASQILQDQVEDMRCTPWTTIQTWTGSSQIALDQTVSATPFVAGHQFSCTRTVSAVTGKSSLMLITYTVSWQGIDGKSRSRTVSSYYYGSGLYSYVSV